MSAEYASYIGVIIGIIGLIIQLWPLLRKEYQYFEHPFSEFDTGQSTIYAKRAGIAWRVNWFIASCLIILAYIICFRLADVNIVDQISPNAFLIIYFIQIIGINLKDFYLNRLICKKKTELFFKKHFDSISSLNLIIAFEIIGLFMLVILFFVVRAIPIKIIIILMLIVLSICYSFFKAAEVTCEYIHIRKVNSLTITMNDGTKYENIKAYNDLGKTVRIMNDPRTISFLSKDSISSITKKMDKKRIIDIVREKSEKEKGKGKEKDANSNERN